MVKIRRFKKLIKEDASSNPYLTQPIKKVEQDIYDSMAKIMNQKKLDLKKLYSRNIENSGLTIPLNKLNTEIVVDVDGKKETINPAQIASYCEYVKSQAMADPDIGVIISRFPKPLLWTLSPDLSTAACDGIRIVFNPIFAQKLLSMGAANFKKNRDPKKVQSSSEKNIAVAKFFLYVLMHEAYHSLYRHIEAAEMKEETSEGKNHLLANIAMDAEINRDIENQFLQFAGCTNAIDGVFDPRFPNETWAEIFDAYYYKNMTPPDHEELSEQWTDPPVKIKPKEQRDSDSSTPPQPQQQFSDDFKKGWSDAIDDVTSSIVDPRTYKPKRNTSDYNKGYNKAMEQIKEGVENGLDVPKNPQPNDKNNPNLRPIPWDLKPNSPQPPQPPKPGDDKGDNNQNGQGGDQNRQGDDQNGQGDDQNGQGGDQNRQGGDDQNGQGDDQNGQGGNQNGQGDDQNGQGDDQNGQGGKPGGNGSNTHGNGFNGEFDNDGDASGYGKDDMPTKMDGKSSDFQKGYQDELNKELKKLGINTPSVLDPASFTGSAEERAGREQARKDIKQIEKDLSEQIEDEITQDKDFDELSKQYEGTEIQTSGSNKFGGSDIVSRETLAKIAAEQGTPYSSEELSIDLTELDRKFQENAINKLKNKALVEKLSGIKDQLLTRDNLISDWRAKLKKHFNEAMESKTTPARKRKLLGQDWRLDRAQPYGQKPVEENNAANLFYLMDNSGSMYFYGGNDIFYQIFKEIITIEKRCKVLRSARAYFSSGVILPQDVEMWDLKTPIDKVIDKLSDRGGSGGTDIPGNILSVTKLKKPYYYQTSDKHTTILVFTDGENNVESEWKILKLIPYNILKDVVFVIFNNKSGLLHVTSLLVEQRVPLKNIIQVNMEDFK